MSRPGTVEVRLLTPVERELVQASHRASDQAAHAIRLEILEACAAHLGRFSLSGYRATDNFERHVPADKASELAEPVVRALAQVQIEPALALAAMAREPIDRNARRTTGAFHTDFRLAAFLAEGFDRRRGEVTRVIDPASGTGALVIALALRLRSPSQRDRFLAESVHAADLSPMALRGMKLAIASLCDNLDVVRSMAPRLRVLDSLLAGSRAWADYAPDGFTTVVGNPPWEKLKVTRHELLLMEGFHRTYGEDYGKVDPEQLRLARSAVARYAHRLGESFDLTGGGEVDLYKLFVELSLDLLRPGGELRLLVPAGLLRSSGTEQLRNHLFDRATRLHFTVADNRNRYFAIDTRFKFVRVEATVDQHRRRSALVISHARGDRLSIDAGQKVPISRSNLRTLRPDLTVPEVRSAQEWSIFRRMSEAGQRSPLTPLFAKARIVRELDMTRDRHAFQREHADGCLPLVEGRMVHQFRYGAKAYESGEGRAAVWRVATRGEAVAPQFWVDPTKLSRSQVRRAHVERFGYCDVTGQTNERTLLAARIPPDAICNNKVPTLSFGGESYLGWLWLTAVNSVAFDWVLRRVVTTTVNYFILRSLPYPPLDPHDECSRELVALAKRIDAAQSSPEPPLEQVARWRARIDAIILEAYGLSFEDAGVIVEDFPLLDRGQPPITGEAHSSATADAVLSAYAQHLSVTASHALRCKLAHRAGARAYVPSEFASALARTERTLVEESVPA